MSEEESKILGATPEAEDQFQYNDALMQRRDDLVAMKSLTPEEAEELRQIRDYFAPSPPMGSEFQANSSGGILARRSYYTR
jgi:hypothetical protein